MDIHWTQHARFKMNYYRLSESRVKRVINVPQRIEEGIAEKTIAVMQSSVGAKNPYEIWVMIQETAARAARNEKEKVLEKLGLKPKKIKVISAWRYPGQTKPGQPLPPEILAEISEAL